MNTILKFFSHFFTPTETNNYKAKTLHLDFLTFYLLVAISLSLFYKNSLVSQIGTSILGVATNINSAKLYELTNKERQKNGLSLLKYSDTLSAAAQKKAANMFTNNYWAHFGPKGQSPWQFIAETGYSYEFAGENLARDFMFSDGVVGAWMNSNTHRENILRPQYEEVGFAVVNGVLEGEETTLVVQMFGKQGENELTSDNRQLTPDSRTLKTEAVLAGNTSFSLLERFTSTSYRASLIIFALLFLGLIFDLYYAHKLGLIRLTGKHVAHFIFLAFIVLSFAILTKGVIL